MAFTKVAVVGGSGTMGNGIVQTVAQAGIKTYLVETNMELAEKGKARLDKSLSKLVEKGKINDDRKNEILGNIVLTDKYEDVADVDFVIEAIFENIQLKKEIFAKLDAIVKPETILASNTSALSITEIASVTKRPEKVIGFHFFNPVPLMPLVELVMGLFCSEETYLAAEKLVDQIGKKYVKAKDTPGFLVNYLQIPLLVGAVEALENGLASAEDIDKACVFGMNHPMGPLHLLDMIGLDNALDVFTVMYESTGNEKFRPRTMHRRLVQSGNWGRKTGKGFFSYEK
ncbi:MAG: 3-hydroxybutyryl-CoA dehydrogenase [Peptococcaceae bacterium]|jgi:3-hydroxybutyryl-CoA dehydrogenase|nr:3-hydroxybutyryl-CoA dehydrogenase [Peptococcaceae bacterium]